MTLKTTCFAILTAALFAGPLVAQGERVAVTPGQMVALGNNFLNEGQPDQAAAIAALLLQRDGNDINGLIIGARAAQAQGDAATAIRLSRRAYWNTEDPAALFVAARLAANGHAALEQDTRSQLWLRRAAQYAPNDDATAGIARDYAALRQRNPWSTSLQFGITPTQNLNNGSSTDQQFAYGIPFIGTGFLPLNAEAQALSGLEIAGGITTRYRLNTGPTSASYFDLSLRGRTYALSQTSQDRLAEEAEGNPDTDTDDVARTRGSDFGDASITLGLTHLHVLREGAQPTQFSFGITRSKSNYNNDPLRHIYSGSISQSWRLGENDSVGLSFTARRRTTVQDDPIVRTHQLDANWSRILGNGNRLTLGTGWLESGSISPGDDFTSLSVNASYDFAQSVAGMKFGFGLSGYQRNWDVYPLFTVDGRRDRSVSARMRVTFENVEFYGFQPVATLEASRTRSNVDRFDTDDLRLGFDLQSSF